LAKLRELKRGIRKLTSKKPKSLNETKARGILLHLEGMKTRKIAKILQVHQRKEDKPTRTSRQENMGSKNIEEKFNVKPHNTLENSEEEIENPLHKTL